MDQHYLTTLVLVGCTLLCEFLTNFNDSFLFEKVEKVAGVQSTDDDDENLTTATNGKTIA